MTSNDFSTERILLFSSFARADEVSSLIFIGFADSCNEEHAVPRKQLRAWCPLKNQILSTGGMLSLENVLAACWHAAMLPKKMLCRVPKIWGRAAPRNRFAVLPKKMRCRIPKKEGHAAPEDTTFKEFEKIV